MPLTPAVVNCWFVLPVTTVGDWRMCSRVRHSKNGPKTLTCPIGECRPETNLCFSAQYYGSLLMETSKITHHSVQLMLAQIRPDFSY